MAELLESSGIQGSEFEVQELRVEEFEVQDSEFRVFGACYAFAFLTASVSAGTISNASPTIP